MLDYQRVYQSGLCVWKYPKIQCFDNRIPRAWLQRVIIEKSHPPIIKHPPNGPNDVEIPH